MANLEHVADVPDGTTDVDKKKTSSTEVKKKDMMMEFVKMEEKKRSRRSSFKSSKRRSKSHEALKVSDDSETAVKKPARKRHATQHHKSAERLPTLTAFDEERIVWMKAMEDDIANQADRQRRKENECQVMRSGRREREEEEEMAISPQRPPPPPTPATTPYQIPYDSLEADEAVEEYVAPTRSRHPSSRATFAPSVIEDSRTDTPVTLPPPLPPPPLSSECFVVSSRGWELDQSKLLRSLDRVCCAAFARVQIVATMNRVVENVRSHLDAVVIHVGSHELLDAAHSLGSVATASKSGLRGRRDKVESMAGSIATVLSRQVRANS